VYCEEAGEIGKACGTWWTEQIGINVLVGEPNERDYFHTVIYVLLTRSFGNIMGLHELGSVNLGFHKMRGMFLLSENFWRMNLIPAISEKNGR
jgi:hypothetical protein